MRRQAIRLGMHAVKVEGETMRVRGLFFFQAEDGIRDYKVTGVQTCALPISTRPPGSPCTPGSSGRPARCRRPIRPSRPHLLAPGLIRRGELRFVGPLARLESRGLAQRISSRGDGAIGRSARPVTMPGSRWAPACTDLPRSERVLDLAGSGVEKTPFSQSGAPPAFGAAKVPRSQSVFAMPPVFPRGALGANPTRGMRGVLQPTRLFRARRGSQPAR